MLRGFRDVTAGVADDVVAGGGHVVAGRARRAGVAVDRHVDEQRALAAAVGHAHRRPRDVVVMETGPAGARRAAAARSGAGSGWRQAAEMTL